MRPVKRQTERFFTLNAAVAVMLDSTIIEAAETHAMTGSTPTLSASRVVLLTEGEDTAADTSALLVGENGRPDPQWVRGRCPECGDDLISNMYFSPGNGYIIRWECWSSRGESPQCGYKRVL